MSWDSLALCRRTGSTFPRNVSRHGIPALLLLPICFICGKYLIFNICGGFLAILMHTLWSPFRSCLAFSAIPIRVGHHVGKKTKQSDSIKASKKAAATQYHFSLGNLLWLLLCGWWLALINAFVGVLLAITVIGMHLVPRRSKI